MLFQKNILKKYLSTLDSTDVNAAWNTFKTYFHNLDIQQNIRNSKEEQFQEGFLRELFVNVLGYTLNPAPDYNLITEQKNETNSKKADGAIIIDGIVIGVIELKDHKTTDLSKIENQAFGYKAQNKNARYIIISNFEKLRLYIDNAVDFEEFHLFTLDFERFKTLYLALNFQGVKNQTAVKMKSESLSREEQITNLLYKDYSEFKQVLYEDILRWNVDGSSAQLYKKTQKLLDRFLFIFFAEDCGLLPPNTMIKIIDDWHKLQELDEYQPLYNRIKKYFNYLDTGYKGKDFEIFAYNGGLFKPDQLLDSLKISDQILETYTRKLSEYDYESEVDVNILGHIFENSLNDEWNVDGSSANKRKRDGVFYTPQYITKYIVDNTVGKLCAQQKNALGIVESEYFSVQKRKKETKLQLLEKLDSYRKWLLQITILDPACGSGAFLNAALKFLMAEHRLIDEMEAKITGAAIVMPNIENAILENNLYGVDINDESVEIAKLSLWLRTAKPHRKLNSLNNNIKCGNSLISDPKIAGEKAFDWQKEFPQVCEKGGFDVVIGNPPYVQLQSLGEMSDVYAECGFESYNKSADLYCLFTEKGYNLLKPNGLLSFIMPNKWMITSYGKELRKFMSKTNLLQILNFGDIQFFQDATIYVCIFVTRKSEDKNNVLALSLNQKNYNGDFLNEVVNALASYPPETFSETEWIIQPKAHFEILQKINKGKSLKNLPISINYGIKTGFNDAFFINSETRSRLISEDAKSEELIKPLLRGRDIQAWIPNWDDQYLIFMPWHFPNHLDISIQGASEKSEIDFKTNYFAIYNHLLQFKDKLSARNKAETGIRYEWYASQRWAADYYQEFSKPKIMYPNMTSAFPFIFDDKGFFGNDKTFMITATDNSFNLKALTTILNSKLCKLWIWYNCPELQGGTREIRKVYFENFPVPQTTAEQEKELCEFADKMLTLNQKLHDKSTRFLRRIRETYNLEKITQNLETFYNLDFKAFNSELAKQKIKLSLVQKDELEDYFTAYKTECTALKNEIENTDKEIDRMVYALYNLNDEEIQTITYS